MKQVLRQTGKSVYLVAGRCNEHMVHDPSATGAASLSSGLLARKGQAAPAVDPTAHEGVELDYYQAAANKAARAERQNPNFDGIEPEFPQTQVHHIGEAISAEEARARLRKFVRPDETDDDEERNEPTPPGRMRKPRLRKRRPQLALLPTPSKPANDQKGPKRVSVTFRMTVCDFVRLRRASTQLGEACQTIISDALDAYLDANDISTVSREEALKEAARLKRKR